MGDPKAKPRRYVPAVGPWLRPLLWAVLLGFGLLGATGAYLAGVSLLNFLRPGSLYTTPFTFWMFLAHAGVGLALTVPYLWFGLAHWWGSRHRPNRRAVRTGILLFAVGLVVTVTGFALFQLEGLPQLPTGTLSRHVAYWLHVVLPVAAVGVYVWHRKNGPKIRWRYGRLWGGVTAAGLLAMGALHGYDPRAAARKGSAEGEKYFHPSEARTSDGKFIPADVLMNDAYCMRCHEDVYKDHLHSAHKFSSGNNPAYLASVNETREVGQRRDGNVKASRWCAGCHDPVPLFSGQFDDPAFDLGTHPTGHAGVTCVVCHSVTEVRGPVGNAAYTLEEPQHYPLAGAPASTLAAWVNSQMVKGQPAFHKKTFLKPLHKTAEFCSTCHKVALPVELTHYKDFVRGQNHYDSYLLSGMGHGARSFYFPERAKQNCADCHMPLTPSADFGAKDYDGSGTRTVHHHSFPGANTGLGPLLALDPRYQHLKEGWQKTTDLNAGYLKDKKLRIDLFGVKRFGADGPDDASLAVLRPELPKLVPGQTYLVETVVRTLALGHHFSQGTVDSNEIWVEFTATDGRGKVIGKNGHTRDPGDSGPVDEWAHFVNVLMLDRHGNRIDRRNPQDIFTPLYDKQIPPGAASVVHYKLTVPADAVGPVTLTARLRYRKFDHTYMEYVSKANGTPLPKLPVVDVCADTVTLPVGDGPVSPQESPVKPAWQRWNDYGIGCLLEGGVGAKRGNLRQAEAAFRKLPTLGDPAAVWHGHANTARVLIELGQLNEAAAEVAKAAACDPPAPWWLRAWLSGTIAAENATSPDDLDAAAGQFERIVDPANRPRDAAGVPTHDFTKDSVVLGQLGRVRFKQAQNAADPATQRALADKAIAALRRALAVDPEDLPSHYTLSQCSALLAGHEAPPADDTPVEDLPAALPKLLAAGQMTRLAAAVQAIGRRPPDAAAPRLAAFQQVRRGLEARPTDPATAQALAVVHREIHALLKPDELARARTVRLYRESHPAANAAAEAIVFYPTDPAGADRK